MPMDTQRLVGRTTCLPPLTHDATDYYLYFTDNKIVPLRSSYVMNKAEFQVCFENTQGEGP